MAAAAPAKDGPAGLGKGHSNPHCNIRTEILLRCACYRGSLRNELSKRTFSVFLMLFVAPW